MVPGALEPVDVVEIQQLLNRVASAADSAVDLAEYGDLLADDVVFVFDAVPAIGLEAVSHSGRAAAVESEAARRAAGLQGPGTGTMHIVNDVVVTTMSVDAASVTAAWQYLSTDSSGPGITAFGTYRDEVRRFAEQWLLTRREVSVLSGQRRPSHFVCGDREQIVGLIGSYARLADERRFLDMAALFTVDGRLEMYRPRSSEPAEVAEGRAELERAFHALEQFATTTHFLGQSLVSIDGDHATAHTYGMSHHIAGETRETRRRITLADRYVDELVRVDGAWFFRERKKLTDWTESTSLQR